MAALLVGRTRPRRVRPASPVLRVAASNLHENHRRRPCDWYILPPFCRRCPASNQSGKAGLRNGCSVQTPMAVNPTLMHRFSSRASLLTTKRLRDHQTCTNGAQFHFQDRSRRASSNTSLRSLISAIENARFTCHRSHAPLPHADSSAGVRYSARHRRAGLNGMLQHSASPASPGLARVAPKTRAARRGGTTRGELASSPRRQTTSLPNNALRWRRGEG